MMPLTKLWLFLLSVLCGLAALLVVALDPELQRREIATQSQAVARAQKISSQFLENQAHQLVQAAAQLSTDGVLQETLSQLSRSQGEPALLHETAQGALRRLATPLSVSFALVTDLRGNVLARIGQDEAVYGDPIDGLPAVEAALRGYRLDDLWLFQGALYRIAAVPVIAAAGSTQGRDRYVGSLVLGRVLGSELLTQIGQLTGVQGAVVARGQILASSLSPLGSGSVFRSQADGGLALSSDALLLLRRGLSTADAVARDGDHWLAFVELPGTAAGTVAGTSAGAAPKATANPADPSALLVLSSSSAGGRVLPVVLREALRQGLAPLTLAVLLGAVGLLYVLGLGVVGSESRLLALSQSSRSSSRREPGARSPSEPSAGPSKSGPPEARPGKPVTDPPAAEPRVPPLAPVDTPPPAVPSLVPAPSQPSLVPSAQSPRWTPSPSAQSPRVTPPPLTSTLTPLPPLAVPEESATPLPPPLPQRSDWGPPGELISDASRAAEYEHTDLASSDLAETRAAVLPPPSSNFEPTVVASAPSGATDPDVTFYQVFQEYVQARERCRESVEGLSYEQFRKRLADSRTAIIREHGCVSVEFHVYIKDGRAALKAIPQWVPLAQATHSPISGP